MPSIYNQVYQAPLWVSINLAGERGQNPTLDAMVNYLVVNGATAQPWPSATFKDTIKKLTTRGWAHAVKPFPYVLDQNFVMVAAAEHLKETCGPNKSLNLGTNKPWHHLVDRRVESPEDYARVFDHILSLQDAITLSHVFDLGDRCHNNNVKSYVLFTVGNPPINLLRTIAQTVIVVGETGDVPVSGLSPIDAVSKLDQTLMLAIGQQQRKAQ